MLYNVNTELQQEKRCMKRNAAMQVFTNSKSDQQEATGRRISDYTGTMFVVDFIVVEQRLRNVIRTKKWGQ